jgi:hypothetical protein
LDRLLLDSELGLLGGPNETLALQIEKHAEGLKMLAKPPDPQVSATAIAVGELVTDRLLRARAEFQSAPSRQQFEPEADALKQVAQDVRRLRRLVYFLPELVRWYAHASLVTPDADDQLDSVLAEQIASLLNGCLELEQLINSNQNRPLSPTLPAQLRDQVDQLTDLHQRLREGLRSVVTQAAARPDVPAFRRQMSVFLHTSLPSLAERVKMRELIERARESVSPPTAAAEEPAAIGRVSPTKWQRLVRRWRMEEALVRLAAPKFSLGPPPSSFQDSDDLWRQMRDAGFRLRDAYMQLDAATGPFATQPRADCMQIVDARDAPFIARLDSGFPVLPISPPAVPVQLNVAWSVGAELPLTADWNDVRLDMNTTAPASLSVSLDFQFDDTALQLRTANGQMIRPGSYPSFDLQSAKRLDLQIRALKVIKDPGESTLRLVNIAAHAASLRDNAELRCLLPRPDEVELLATRVGATNPEVSFPGTDQMIQLRPYPNRTTHFRWQLRNVSGSAKSVQVRLLALPPIVRSTWPPGRILGADQKPISLILRSLFEPDGHRLLPNIKVVAQTGDPLALPADGKAVDLILSAPPAPPAPSPPPAAAGADSPAAPPVPPPVDISGGLLCVVEQGDQRWLKWIELQPIPPRDYVAVNVTYDLDRLSIELRPRATERMPLGLEQNPIQVTWEINRLIEEQLRVGDRIETGSMATNNDQVQLYADVATAQDRQASVRLSVDQYPRAFIFEVPLDRRSEQDDPRRDLPELVIQSLSMSNFPRVYVTSAAEARQFVASQSPDDKRKVVELQPGQFAAFPKPNTGDQMEIRLRADAAVSAFGRADTKDQISVQLKDRLGVTTFQESRYADRQATFYLGEVAGGSIAVQTVVNDHRILVTPQRMEGEYQLLAAMVVENEDLRYPRIPIVFDGQPPRIVRPLAVPSSPVEAGKPFEVSFEVTDESGVERIDVGLVKTLADPLDDKTKVVLERPTAQRIRLRLSSAEPGDFWVKAAVVDRVDRVTETKADTAFVPVRVKVVAPPDPKATSPEQVVGRVFGSTQIRERKIDRIEVRLTGDKEFPAVITANGGQFEFRDVPAGKYQLQAAGYWNGERVGVLPIELKAPSDYVPFEIQLQPKPRDKN